MKKIVIGIIGLVVICILLVILFGVYRSNLIDGGDVLPKGDVACTQEAMLCPDGTAVGRTGPKCEFAPCPSVGQKEGQPEPDSSLIIVSEPRRNDAIASPLIIRGEARGTWYFEATFPVSLENEGGKIIAIGTARAEGDWMTENFVPFTATLTYVSEKEQSGVLILRNDNPSGLPENAHELRIPVILQSTEGTAFRAPIDRASERVTKKPFGILIKRETSPVQPERFSGYHTGTDFETFPAESDTAVSVYAVCTGKLEVKRRASGYGGLIAERCTLDGKSVSVIYGHLALGSVTATVGDVLEQGSVIGTLGKAESADTDGERKHLHLGIFKGTGTASILGYVASQKELDQWIDPCLFVCK